MCRQLRPREGRWRAAGEQDTQSCNEGEAYPMSLDPVRLPLSMAGLAKWAVNALPSICLGKLGHFGWPG